jgi:hypothetical protein
MSESYVYNIDSNQDRDILNQGSVPHIVQYFNKLEKQHMGDKTLDTSNENETSSPYSINSTSFAIKLIALISLIIIFWDFVNA